jgi:protein involved in polysaccharide export with SLBB domain
MFSAAIRSRGWSLALLMATVAFGNGCAALSNPVAAGVPVSMLPKEVLARPKAELVAVPLTLLRLKEQAAYKLDKGDVLAVIAGDLFGPEQVQPPLSTPNPGEGVESTVGYPVPVRDDGTISLPNPKIPPINVKGKTTEQVEAYLRRALTGAEPGFPEIFKEGGAKISVQLMRKRRFRVSVIRSDIAGGPVNIGGVLTSQGRTFGSVVTLEAGRNDVLNALNASGGTPGNDAKNEVWIYRGEYDPANPAKGQARIPLKIYPDQQLTISEADITLNEGDILVIPGREAEVFYVGGIINSRQIPLPREVDFDVIAAVAVANGPIINGAFQNNQFVAQSIATGLGTPSPALVNVLRQLPNGSQLNIRIDMDRALKDPRERILMQPGDILLMQERPYEAFARYLTQQFRFNFTQQIWKTLTGSGVETAILP